MLALESTEPVTYTPVHIINIDIQDNHEEATLGAFIVCHLCEKVCGNFMYQYPYDGKHSFSVSTVIIW